MPVSAQSVTVNAAPLKKKERKKERKEAKIEITITAIVGLKRIYLAAS